MSNSPINIDALKSGANTNQGPDQIVDPNLNKNIDGKDVRDFGNGMKEFDPAANGFKAEEVDHGVDPEQKALDELDKVLEEKAKEVQVFNDLQDMNGGVVSEAEVREALDQGYITEDLKDGKGGKYEEEPTKEAKTAATQVEAETPVTQAATPTISSEDKDLEDELEADDMPVAPIAEEVPKQTTKPVQVKTEAKPIDKSISNPSPAPVVSFDDRKESVIDANGKSQEDKDLDALDGVGSDTASSDDDIEAKLRAEIRKKINPVKKKFDLSSAEVIRKPASVNNYVANKQRATKRTFMWPLFRSGRPIKIQSFNANELNILSEQARSNTPVDVFRTIYNHIVGPKGADFDQWAKCTSYFDVNHLWFAIYGACFYGSNYLPFSCEKCREITVTTDTPLMDMVKFKDDEAKKLFDNIMNMPEDEKFGSVFAESRIQVADDLVIGFKEPNIYNSMVENAYYDRDFRQKYNDIINISNYISDIYFITDDGNLEPFATKEYPNNAVKTAKARIIQYAKLIRSLSSDEYGVVMTAIVEMGRDTEPVTYQMPEITCEKCGAVIPAEEQDASSLVFTRHQLVMYGI